MVLSRVTEAVWADAHARAATKAAANKNFITRMWSTERDVDVGAECGDRESGGEVAACVCGDGRGGKGEGTGEWESGSEGGGTGRGEKDTIR